MAGWLLDSMERDDTKDCGNKHPPEALGPETVSTEGTVSFLVAVADLSSCVIYTNCLEWFLRLRREIYLQHKTFIITILKLCFMWDGKMYFYIAYIRSLLYLLI